MSKILLLEDDAELRRIVAFALEDGGHECVPVGDGQEALEALCRHTTEGDVLACAVLDIFMPGPVDGWQVLEAMRKTPVWAEIPAIVLTGKATLPAEVERAHKLRAAHLQKSARFVDELLEKIAELTGGAQS